MPTLLNPEPKARNWKAKVLRGGVHAWTLGAVAFLLQGTFENIRSGPNVFLSIGNLVGFGVVYAAWLAGLANADKVTGHDDPITRRRGKRAERAILIAMASFAAVVTVVFLVLWLRDRT